MAKVKDFVTAIVAGPGVASFIYFMYNLVVWTSGFQPFKEFLQSLSGHEMFIGRRRKSEKKSKVLPNKSF